MTADVMWSGDKVIEATLRDQLGLEKHTWFETVASHCKHEPLGGAVLHTTVAAFILFYFVFYCCHTVFIATPSCSSTLVKNESRSVSYIHFKPLGYLTSLTCIDIKRNS